MGRFDLARHTSAEYALYVVTPVQQLRLGFEMWLRFLPGVVLTAIMIWGVPVLRNRSPILAAGLLAVCFLGLFYVFRKARHWIHDVENRLVNRLPLRPSQVPSSIIVEQVIFIQGSNNRVENSNSFNEARTRRVRS